MMPQNKRKIQNWQIERAKARGSARRRRAALALYAPLVDAPNVGTGRAGRLDTVILDGLGDASSCKDDSPLTNSVSANLRRMAESAAGLPHPVERQRKPAAGGIHSARCNMARTQEDLNTKTPEIVPQGSIMAPYISTSFLLGDDAEMTLRRQIAARVVPPKRAGLAWGAITHGVWTTNSYAPEKGESFIRWHGEIGFQKADGSLGEATVAYLPKPVQADLITAGIPIVREADPLPAPMVCTFSVECWCVPVRQQPGFGYEIRNRQGRRRNINALAPPEVQALLPQLPPPVSFDVETAHIEYDNETGEILETSADAEIIADRIIHHAREERDAAE